MLVKKENAQLFENQYIVLFLDSEGKRKDKVIKAGAWFRPRRFRSGGVLHLARRRDWRGREEIIGPPLGFFDGIDYICACARCDGHCRRPAPAG